MINPQLEISVSINSLFMVKGSYQCMNYFYDFGPPIGNEESVDSLSVFKDSYEYLKEFSDFGPS